MDDCSPGRTWLTDTTDPSMQIYGALPGGLASPFPSFVQIDCRSEEWVDPVYRTSVSVAF